MTALAEKILEQFRSANLEDQFVIANSIVREWSSNGKRPMLPAVGELRPSADYGVPPTMTDEEIAELQHRIRNLRDEDCVSAEEMLASIELRIEEENPTR